MVKKSARKPKPPGAPALKVISGGKGAAAERAAPDKAAGRKAGTESTARGKRVQFDLETWHALNLLARDRMMTFQELADEAFHDLLRKHGRPTDLKDALRRSLKNAETHRPGQHRKAKPSDGDD